MRAVDEAASLITDACVSHCAKQTAKLQSDLATAREGLRLYREYVAACDTRRGYVYHTDRSAIREAIEAWEKEQTHE